MRVLVVDDDESCRAILSRFLAEYGEVDVRRDGLEATEAIRSALDDSRPYDLVCLDIMMPKLDGLSTLREIRSTEAEKKVAPAKVLMTTCLDDQGSISEAFMSECDGYLMKPISMLSLVGAMKRLGFSAMNATR